MPFPQLRSGNINLLAGLIATVNGDGTSALVFSNSGTLLGDGALAGTCALAFSTTATGASVAFTSGSSDLAFSVTGTFGSVGVLEGSSALVFGEGSSTLSSQGTLAGSAAIAFGESATLTADGALVGQAGTLLTPTGTTLGAGALTGSSALTFSLIAASAGESSVGGTASLTFGAGSSTLIGSGALAGSAALLLDTTGTAETAAALVGTVALAFSNSGTISGTSSIAGSAAIAFSLTGAVESLTHGECVPPTHVNGASGTLTTYPGGGTLSGDDVTWFSEEPDAADAFDDWVEMTGLFGVIQVSFDPPSGTLQTGVGLQRFRVLIQRATAVTTGWRIELRENGVFRSILATGSLTDDDPVVVTGVWNASLLTTDPTGGAVNLRFSQTSSGTTLKVGAMEWCQVLAGAPAPDATMVGPWVNVMELHAGKRLELYTGKRLELING